MFPATGKVWDGSERVLFRLGLSDLDGDGIFHWEADGQEVAQEEMKFFQEHRTGKYYYRKSLFQNLLPFCVFTQC